MKIENSVRKLPKAELHVHIEGTVTQKMARRKAKEHGITLDESVLSEDGEGFKWNDFVDCVTRVYDAVASTIRTKQDYEDITYDYLKRCAEEGCIYVELIISPDHCERMGLPYAEMVDGIAKGIDRARDDFDIEARMNAAIVRHLSMKDVEKDADIIANNRHPYVTGLDLAGAEKEGDIPAFRQVFKGIKDKTNAELGWRIHAGEAAGAANVRAALDLHVKRIGHGVKVVEDLSLVKELADSGVVLEICPTSNILAGIYDKFEDHPLRQLKDAGVKVTLNSDDPGLFGNSIGTEYQIAKDKFGFSDEELLETTRTSVEAAFVDEKLRGKLMKKVEDFGFFLTARQQNKGPGFQPPSP